MDGEKALAWTGDPLLDFIVYLFDYTCSSTFGRNTWQAISLARKTSEVLVLMRAVNCFSVVRLGLDER